MAADIYSKAGADAAFVHNTAAGRQAFADSDELKNTIGEVATDSTGKRVDSFPVADARGIRAPLGDSHALAISTPYIRRVQNHPARHDDQALRSLYNPVVIHMEGLISNPLGRYYVYYSTNHDSTTGGIALATCDNLGDPLTLRGQVFVNTTPGSVQAETPDVHWNPDVALIQQGAGPTATASTGRIAQVPATCSRTDRRCGSPRLGQPA